MALTDQERRQVAQEFVAECSRRGLTPIAGLLKADVLAAVAGLDVGFDSVATTLNQSIPQPARGGLTTDQKGLLLTLVQRKKGIGE